ncbi:fungal specific transcription factor [Colletotrichum musicola]|uniref:Fungal specific transcription factor n=1 Tax=Colletotrichum musicola TaxID=2175873 RepID=A0A8H6JCJ6_9PEZI|nr:fungal specific transcription factor [Colletotrichum musicola]
MQDSITIEADEPVSATDLPSCEGCRRRKLKCTRQKPLCSHCERLGIECVYENRRSKPGLKGGAVESLNKRLEAVERVVFNQDDHCIRPNVASPSTSHQPASEKPDDTTSVLGILSTLAKEINKLNSTLATPASSQISAVEPAPRWTTNAQLHVDDSESGRPTKRRRQDDNDQNETHVGVSQTNPPHGSNYCLPVLEDVLDELLTIYFTRVQPWIPLLQEARFRRRLRKEERGKLSVILHAMIVAALRFVKKDGQLLSPGLLEEEVGRARGFVILTSMTGLTVEHLQALSILAFTDIGNGENERAWPIIGSLSRTVEYLQLSVEDEGRPKRSSFIRPRFLLQEPKSWAEEEERRRVFWNIFILDSISVAYKVQMEHQLDSGRRIPSTASHYPSPSQPISGDGHEAEVQRSSGSQPGANSAVVDMSTIGAFAYYIESIESLTRVNTYFLQQDINFKDRKEVSNWLTRFKELDLRLVHWKMFLPQQWKDSGISRKEMPGVMDPNMTVAHTTHNTSMILLHQRIAYPEPELGGIKLPSAYSDETCQGAASETANMVMKYLDSSPVDTLVSPQMSFCCFVSGKVLLVHWKRYGDDLSTDFWVLVDCLEEMSRRWLGAKSQASSLSGHFAERLRKLHQLCRSNVGLQLSVLEFADSGFEETGLEALSNVDAPQPVKTKRANLKQGKRPVAVQGQLPIERDPPSVESTGDNLSAISRDLMDQRFTEMDRIMSYDDIMFNTRLEDFNAGSSDGWAIQENELGSNRPAFENPSGSFWNPN